MMKLTRRPLAFVIDSFNDKRGMQRQKIMVDNPVAGTFRVSDGRVTADITFSELGIEVDAVNAEGTFEKIKTRKV